MSGGRRPIVSRGLLAVLVAAAIGAMSIAGCGSSGGGVATGTEASSTSSSGYIVESRDAVSQSEGATEIQTAAFPHGHDTDEVSATGAKPVRPCALVRRAQAENILGGKVKIAEHLQGPTCVFSGSGREVTLVVMEARLKPIVAAARDAKPLTLAGHRAWCLRYETTSVVAAVGKGRVLQVAGACPAAARFAAAALRRISP
ncbi:MAG TPA: hypothetical protein VHA80_11840 [Solirubrobacterales bacterium]|nr:hypothetical protein [Solirubrobacterales bacterium]